MSHEPDRQVTQLFQCLTQDKKNIGFLFGAGCPYAIKKNGEPLIQNIKGLTYEVNSKLQAASSAKEWEEIVNQLVEDGISEPNIEDILSRVRGLREYVGKESFKGLNKEILDGLEEKMCEAITSSVDKALPSLTTPYHKLASWIGSTRRTQPIQLFTTNYDLLIEQALEDIGIPFYDGFVGACKPFFDPYSIDHDKLPARWAKLWKIHGSINWKGERNDKGYKVWRSSSPEKGNVLIHPSHLKYDQSRKMPYLAMMDQLKKFISTPHSVLIIIGYSFGDQHLNDLIIQSLQGTPSSAIFALMFGNLSDYQAAIKIAKERSNLSILAENAAVIGTKESLWKTMAEKPDPFFSIPTVKWVEEEGAEHYTAQFMLGHFEQFGLFLQEISGKMKDVE